MKLQAIQTEINSSKIPVAGGVDFNTPGSPQNAVWENQSPLPKKLESTK